VCAIIDLKHMHGQATDFETSLRLRLIFASIYQV